MAKKKAIIHIGGHKTGSTAIQAFCALNAVRLARQDIVYPLELLTNPEKPWGQAHHGLVNLFMDATTFWKTFDLRPKKMNDEDVVAYLKALPREKNILLSTENLVWLDTKSINALRQYLDGFDVVVVLYVRRQDNAMQALYQTVVTSIGETRQFDDYVDDVVRGLFQYDKIAEDWQSVFGAGKLVVRVYESDQLYRRDAVLDFMHVLENILQTKIDSSDWNRNVGAVNRGLPAHITGLIRYHNNFFSKKLTVRAIRIIARLLYKNSRGSYDIIRPSQRRELLESFAESNENLARKILRREDGILFHDLGIKQSDEEWDEKYNRKGCHFRMLMRDLIAKLQPQKVS
jgi:hypothetical protein